jgi:hypothetical protein
LPEDPDDWDEGAEDRSGDDGAEDRSGADGAGAGADIVLRLSKPRALDSRAWDELSEPPNAPPPNELETPPEEPPNPENECEMGGGELVGMGALPADGGAPP